MVTKFFFKKNFPPLPTVQSGSRRREVDAIAKSRPSLTRSPSLPDGRTKVNRVLRTSLPSINRRSITDPGGRDGGGRERDKGTRSLGHPAGERERGELSQSVCSAVCPLFCLSEYGGSGKGSFLLFKFKFEIHFLGFCSWNVQSWACVNSTI